MLYLLTRCMLSSRLLHPRMWPSYMYSTTSGCLPITGNSSRPCPPVLAPLHKLFHKNVERRWSSVQDKVFQESKELLTSSRLLVHFDPKLPLFLVCDTLAYGIAAVLAHWMPDGSKQPIGYASRALNSAERNYSQLEK